MLDVVDLRAGYGMSRVLFGVNLRVRRGEVVALLGRNGAGKTTVLKAIMGLVAVTAGRVLLEGREVSGLPPYAIARAGIGYVPQERRIFPDLTVRENLDVARHRRGADSGSWDRTRVVALFPALGALLDRRGDSLSGGEQQMLAVARTLMGNPRILLLDEPSEGLAPLVAQALAAQLLRLKSEGVTMVLSEQNVRFTSHVADRAYVLEKGHVRHEGDMLGLGRDDAVMGRYLSI